MVTPVSSSFSTLETPLGADRQQNNNDQDSLCDASNDVTKRLRALFHPGATNHVTRIDDEAQTGERGINYFQDENTDNQNPGDSDKRNEDGSVDETERSRRN